MKEERIQNVKPKEYCGIKYRSTLEADTAKTLDTLGIPFLYEHRKIVLLEGFRCIYSKEKVRAITYTPDFEIGNIIIECKGFETPEWKNKKKYLFKYLMKKEPKTFFYEAHNAINDVIGALDRHLDDLGYIVEVSTPDKDNVSKYKSIMEAKMAMRLEGKSNTPINNALLNGKKAYGHLWRIIRKQ